MHFSDIFLFLKTFAGHLHFVNLLFFLFFERLDGWQSSVHKKQQQKYAAIVISRLHLPIVTATSADGWLFSRSMTNQYKMN